MVCCIHCVVDIACAPDADGVLASRFPQGKRLFDQLPADIKPIVQPYLSSRFTYTTNTRAADQEGVVFGRQQHSFR